ncbi:PilZ domain-containing protein [Anaerobacterium chartisolvens]|uniref:PilZ domain-containing protein n=1 Tax=Anaerobacterium chartisolvens TaxID=1297424 RepID=A0A369B9X4_9FIRM|nr:PilZ domain-containing protein [Anaerobacterium chartisolvens]RCX18322.1 PilZ domain-containing protein [Anaerobacterium chartisolvens]
MNPFGISSILKEGLVASTKLGYDDTWHQNVIYRCVENIIWISLPQYYIQNIIMDGSKITIKYCNEFFEYLFEGVAFDIVPDYPAHVKVVVHSVHEIVNTRSAPRYDTYLPSRIKSCWKEAKYFCITTNISSGGVAFTAKNEFDYGEDTEMWIYLPDNQIINVQGKLIRKSAKNKLFTYSMQFSDVYGINSKLLSSYLAYLDKKNSTLQFSFFDTIKKLL